jgi:Cu/Ag efflux protein CusF
MKRKTLSAALAAALALAAQTFAGAALAQSTPQVAGVVTKIDASADKITIKHAPIPNLDMGEMTMVFRAGEKAMLGQVKPGDKIVFTAERVNGQITLTSLAKAK